MKHRRPSNRPVVCVPWAYTFNEMIGIDLKTWGNKYFLVVVDIATRFCTATVIRNKLPATIVKGLFLSWVAIFGPPAKIIQDNGGEFSNAEMRAFGEAFSIQLIYTAAESPWSNGVVERLNGVLGKLVLKILDDVNCDTDIALAWAVAARNTYYNNSGYTPNQLVFGFNPSMPNIYNSKPPGLKRLSSIEMIGKITEAKRVAMEEFVKFDSCEKLKKALSSKIRTTILDDLKIGDEVYYKRLNSEEWHGPAKVILIEGKVITVKHGSVSVKVNTVSLVKIPHICGPDCDKEENKDKLDKTIPGKSTNMVKETETKLDNTHSPNKQGNGRKRKRETSLDNWRNWKSGERFQGIDMVTGEHISGKIINKVEGTNRNLYNIESDQDGHRSWFDMSEIKDLTLIREEIEMIILYNNDKTTEAKEKELQNWIQNNVFEVVENTGQKYITVRWVITEKMVDGVLVIKARLVVRGFEENTQNMQKDAPTCSREAIRLLVTIASAMHWDCHAIDVKSAYVQGDTIQRNIYLKPPKEYDDGKLWKLNKTVYGLCDAARAWYLRVKNELKDLSVEMCRLDNSLFAWKRKGKLEGLICIYVDDFLYAGTEGFYRNVIQRLKQKFLIGSTESIAFTYVGLSIKTYKDGITIDQTHYIAGMETIPINRKRASEKKEELNEDEKKPYRGLTGQLSWISTHTRPDIAFEACRASSAFYGAKVEDLRRLNKLVERVKGESINLYFPRLQGIMNCSLECFTDASLHNLPNCNSQEGLLIFLQDQSGKRCPIFWKSKKIDRKVKSTIAAETLALVDGAEKSVEIAHILRQLLEGIEVKINCYTDNKSIADAISSTKKIDNPMLNIDSQVIRDYLQKGWINQVKWIKSEMQLADPLTKVGVCTDKLKNAISRH